MPQDKPTRRKRPQTRRQRRKARLVRATPPKEEFTRFPMEGISRGLLEVPGMRGIARAKKRALKRGAASGRHFGITDVRRTMRPIFESQRGRIERLFGGGR